MSKSNRKWQAFMERNRKSNGYLMRKTIFNIGYKICRAILIFGLCFLIVQPLLNKISLSFMEEQDLYDSTIVNIPRHFTTSSYKLASQLTEILEGAWNNSIYKSFCQRSSGGSCNVGWLRICKI